MTEPTQAGVHPSPPIAGSDRWKTVAWSSATLLVIVLVAAIAIRMYDSQAGTSLAGAIVRGDRPLAPKLPTEAVLDGADTTVPDDRVLVVNWWASWCGPCREEAPILKKIADDYAGRVAVVGLNAGGQDMRNDARGFAREFDLEFVLVRGTRADEDAWGTTGFPETFVVGTDGRISSLVKGPIEEETLRAMLDDELAANRPPVADRDERASAPIR